MANHFNYCCFIMKAVYNNIEVIRNSRTSLFAIGYLTKIEYENYYAFCFGN